MACNGVNYDPFQLCRSSGHLCEKIMKQLMLSATAGGEALKMTSREIAELVESRHDSVKRTIETLVAKSVIVQPHTVDEQDPDSMGRMRATVVYVFSGDKGYRDSIIVVAQLCPQFTARIVDRWQELEAAQLTRQPVALEAGQPVIAPELIACVNGGIMTKRAAFNLIKDWITSQHSGMGAEPHHSARQRNAVTADDLPPVAVQLELAPPVPAPAPARKPRNVTPAPKPVVLPSLRLYSSSAVMNVGDLDRFVLHEVAEYVSGGLPELQRAMLARGFINEFDAPTKKAAGLHARSGGRTRWYVLKLLRACGAIGAAK